MPEGGDGVVEKDERERNILVYFGVVVGFVDKSDLYIFELIRQGILRMLVFEVLLICFGIRHLCLKSKRGRL